jgi:hypothetical protein
MAPLADLLKGTALGDWQQKLVRSSIYQCKHLIYRCTLHVTDLFTWFMHLFHVSWPNVGFEEVFCVSSCRWETVHKRMRFGSMGRTSTPDLFTSIASARRRVVVRHVSSNTWSVGGTMWIIVHVFHPTFVTIFDVTLIGQPIGRRPSTWHWFSWRGIVACSPCL